MWHLIGFKYAEEYVSFWLTEFLHSWPHIAYQGLQKYSSTFDPDDAKYVQVNFKLLKNDRNNAFEKNGTNK